LNSTEFAYLNDKMLPGGNCSRYITNDEALFAAYHSKQYITEVSGQTRTFTAIADV